MDTTPQISKHEEGALTVPISYAKDQQGLRLIELTPELVELLESSDVPAQFSLKSSIPIPIPKRDDGATEQAFVRLCTDNKTYQVRQVQTSNTVLVLKAYGKDGLCAFSTCAHALELALLDDPELVKVQTPAQTLKSILPYLDGQSASEDDYIENKERPHLSKEQLLIDIPYSRGECEAAYHDCMLFTHGAGEICFQAPSWVLLRMWTCIAGDVTSEHINVSKAFLDLEENGYVPNLVTAFLHPLSRKTNREIPNKEFIVPFVGNAIIDTLDSTAELHQVWKLIDRWKSLLPEAWHDEVTLERFMVMREKALALTRKYKELGNTRSNIGQPKAAANKRNWHERLKRASNT